MAKKVTKKTETKKAAPRARRGKDKMEAARETAVAVAPAIPEERIRARAYEIFRTGANPRDPVADWFQAEQELAGEARA